MMTTITVFHIDRCMFGRVFTDVDARSCWQAGLYEKVAVIECTGKEHAYMLTQNLDGPWYKNEEVEAPQKPMRSTSVGDLICVPGEGYLLCKSVGWQHVDGIADYSGAPREKAS